MLLCCCTPHAAATESHDAGIHPTQIADDSLPLFSREIAGHDPASLVQLYDLVVHSETASPRWSAEHRRCSSRQRTVRRAIEQHAHWREIAQQWHHRGTAYPNGNTFYTPSLISAAPRRPVRAAFTLRLNSINVFPLGFSLC